ncbi:MAG: RNA polymerase sigma factor [Bacteroidetes bacterium]|nr:RNA polymerase sigma factor [Bacteroidota bacterium]
MANITDNISDTELINECKQGSTTAFKTLYDKYSGRIYSLALRMCGSNDIADDLTQDVFIKVWESISSFKGDSAFYSWLHRICINCFLMKLRTDKNYEKKIGESFNNSLMIAYTNDDFSLDMEKAIQKLPSQAKLIFILFEIEGYKHKEISQMLNIEEGTSKAHLHKARKILREELVK